MIVLFLDLGQILFYFVVAVGFVFGCVCDMTSTPVTLLII